MAEEDINPNPVYLVPELLEEIFLRLPLKSILKFKTVSKQWRSILESRRFMERRHMMTAQEKPKIMAAGDRKRFSWSFQGDQEVEMVYLHCDLASRPSLSCDGLVCIPVPGWVNVFNPSTGEFIRFPSGPDPVKADIDFLAPLFEVFPGFWRMGFGRDSVTWSYKIVRMCFTNGWNILRCEILDVNIGRWCILSPPPYEFILTSAWCGCF
ncbi:unnamed protein product [Eruca vesicaria subsp. sativa]|uniref:F-box domain-containing protein n=1 Tax=Eruca vesicaria subsp. sativa TaxID=29727 RepID=A0ABC8J6U8_ERUVS|nr:unnamed protein product [Eruca vesicaria subsp. sativa]